jgi:nitrite reductase (NADH) small subunit
MSTWHRIGTLAEIESRQVRRLVVGGKRIGFFVLQQKVYALFDECPHRGAWLSDGDITPDGYVSCPLHAWEYHVITGAGREDWEGCVASYPVEEREGVYFVCDEPRPAPSEPPPSEKELP